MVMVDEARWPYRGELWCHMTADTTEELHDMASTIGLKRCWYRGANRHPHYDLSPKFRALAIKNGAIFISSFEQARIRRVSANNDKM